MCKLLVDRDRPSSRPREQFDRAIVVRWAEPAGDDEEVVVEPGAQRSLQLRRFVTDDGDADGIDAQPEERGGQIRPVPVLPVASDELRARRDDARSQAGCQPVGVTMITRGWSPGTCTSLP